MAMLEGAHWMRAVDHSLEAQRFRRAWCRCSEIGSDCGVPSTDLRSHRLRAGATRFAEERLADGGAATGFEDVFDGDVVAPARSRCCLGVARLGCGPGFRHRAEGGWTINASDESTASADLGFVPAVFVVSTRTLSTR